ncbi:TIGR04104 family putative zinc finger protein [Sutcliffiella deserti]|uniref:TIGR04104 family putative zinc finger protein n=1 Tax=Sutcliffiella deserti TaxID=2875501 RepID=UPI001CC1200E|nr:TIGR04104 family putative zinc finger protein [Sutcliffiella deserti]
MSFQQCINCKEKITYKRKLYSIFFGYRPITCESCGTVHEVDERYRFIFSLYTIMIPIILVYMVTGMFEIESRFIQVLFVLLFATIGVLYTASRITYHKSKYQQKQ